MFEVGPTAPFEGGGWDPLKVGQSAAPPRGATESVSQSWTVTFETTIAEGVGDSGRTKLGKGVSREQETGTLLGKGVSREQETGTLLGKGVSREQETGTLLGKGVSREQETGTLLGKGVSREQERGHRLRKLSRGERQEKDWVGC